MSCYEIQLAGHLDHRWEALFEDFSIEHLTTPAGEAITALRGAAVDQAALYGLLGRLRDLGANLISVQTLPEPGAAEK